jgi:uncharacterized protein (TIGR04222 family)
MIPKEHQDLWNNIQQFAFDEPNATITFSKKLANQQKWPAAYTARVIEEYRKFMLLCCISPKGASPSKAVDEAWHLHLTYTQSYWNAFCKNTLGRDIHHYPSGGGEQEDHKHENWYDDTLKLYESVFDTSPPADIWTRTVKQEPAMQSMPVPPQQYHIGKELMLIVFMLLLLPFGISYFITGEASPFSLKGSQFLLFYALFAVATLIAHYLLRKDKFQGMKKKLDALPIGDITIFQLTHTVYGKERALQTSLVDLYRRELVSVDESGKIVVHRNKYQAPEKEENPLIPALLINADGNSLHYDTIVNDWYNKESFEHAGVEKMFRVTDQKEYRLEKWGVILIALLLGLARIMQGWYNNRPVVFLFLEIIALLVVAGIISYSFSTSGIAYKKLKALLHDKAGSKQMHTDEVVNDYSLNGPAVLDWLPATLMLGSMFAIFPTPAIRRPVNDNSGDNSWDSSCGSSDTSCGSGSDSSCGGGGGCGGCSGGSD